jgi:hypothetical protein
MQMALMIRSASIGKKAVGSCGGERGSFGEQRHRQKNGYGRRCATGSFAG